MNTEDLFPKDSVSSVISFLSDPADIAACERVCRSWRDVARERAVSTVIIVASRVVVKDFGTVIRWLALHRMVERLAIEGIKYSEPICGCHVLRDVLNACPNLTDLCEFPP